MSTLYTYRVLFTANDDLSLLPLADDEENQEYCGQACEGDFVADAADNGRCGPCWEFVTTRPLDMEEALNADPNVIIYSSREGGLQG